jgi:hypothetical protein
MDSTTIWLLRAASVMIILIGLALILAVPIVAFTISSKLSVAQDSAQEILRQMLELILQQVST